MIFRQLFDSANSTCYKNQRIAQPVTADPVREQPGRGTEKGDGHGSPHGGAS